MAYYMRNYSQNGIEIYFEKKPSEALRNNLKENGWRWSGFKRCWYNYYSEDHLQFAESICTDGQPSRTGIVQSTPPTQLTHTSFPKSSVTTKTTGARLPSSHGTAIKPKLSSTSETTAEAKSTTRLPAGSKSFYTPVIQSKRSNYSEGDECIVSDKNGKRFLGKVNVVDSSEDKVLVTYIAKVYPWGNHNEVDWFSFKNIEKYRSSVSDYSLRKGRIVEYICEEGPIIKGVIDKDNYNSTYNISTYLVDGIGKIKQITEYAVDISRIIEIDYTSSSIIPVKEGDKIEYQSTLYGTVIGKVTYVNYDGTIDITYDYFDEYWETKEKGYESEVPLDQIRLMTKGKKVLERSSYITHEQQKSIDLNEKIKERIKNRSDLFYDASGIAQSRVLYRHQKAGTILAETYDKFAFFYDTGTGKTIMALDIIAKKQKDEGARFLIIAPKSIIKTAWLEDATNHYPNLHILPIYNGFTAQKKRKLLYSWRTGGRVADWESDPLFYAHVKLLADAFGLGEIKIDNDSIVDEALKAAAHHYIINPELFIRTPEKYIEDLGITGIVMDESAILKNYYGKTSEVMRRICSNLKYVYLLSGKPAPNNIVEYFSQMKIVDPKTFSMSYDSFINMFCFGHDRNLQMLPANKDLFAEMVSIRSLIITKKDCLDLPDTIDVVRQIDLPEDIMHDYNSLYYECMTIIKGMNQSKIFYSAQSRLAILMKLRQMASGFFMTGDRTHRESQIIVDIHNAKLHELNAIIDQIPEEQIIIWCQFQHEIEIIEKELSKRAYTVTAYGKTKDLEKSIDDFKKGHAQYIVAHPKTLKYGVTFTNCKYTVYYSFSYSAEDYDQSHDRNYRLGQTETCTYIFIQAADTIDEIMYDKVMHKLSNAEFFEKLIKDAAKHGIDYDQLKEKTDDEIRSALSSEEEGSINLITSGIIKKTYESRKGTEPEYTAKRTYTTYDYLDRIEEPSEQELQWVENFFIDKETRLFLGDGPYSERLIDTSRSDYFDFVHAEEPIPIFQKNMLPNDFELFLTFQPEEDRWVYEMYRAINTALSGMPDYVSEVLTEKYGLADGKPKANTTIANKLRKEYYTGYGYTWNTARVAEEIRDGLYRLWTSNVHMSRYVTEIKRIFLL